MADDACCGPVPAATVDYKTKGKYVEIGGLKTYVTGSETSKRGIIDCYDIFGITPPTLQGADRLAASVNAVVLVPDFFEGKGMNKAWMPPDTEEKKRLNQEFRDQYTTFNRNYPLFKNVIEDAKTKFSSVESWAAFGLCWGAKLAAAASGPETPFKVSGQAHPRPFDAEDAEQMVIPHICLASPGEPADVVAQYAEILSRPGKIGVVETYDKMYHGWMGTRADLADEEKRKEYERGYNQVSEFFNKYL